MRYSWADLSQRIRTVRGERTQQEFAHSHQTSQGYISELEAGKAQPSFKFLLSLATQEQVSLDWLITGKGSRNYLPAEDEQKSPAVREKLPQVYEKVDTLLLAHPELSPTLVEFLDLFFKLKKE